jgi:S1-C subfamily serine protease
MQARTRYSLVFLTLLLGVSFGVIITSRLGISPPSSAAPQAEGPRLTIEGPPGVPMDTTLFRNIARRENPAVVSVTTRARVIGYDPGEDLFRWFFGQQPVPRERIQRGLGSAFLMGQSGEF